jgi:two-component system, cell cycle sensor histidine kinase and response regulator CckA
MDRDKLPSFDSSDTSETVPLNHLRNGNLGTETIDLGTLPEKGISESGSFHIGSDIWASTFGRMIQVLPIPVLLLDLAGIVVVGNRSCAKLGIGQESILNKPFSRLFARPAVAAQCESIIKSVFDSRKSATWEAALRIDTRDIWARVTLRAVRIQGQRFLLVIVEDLSLERQQRLQEQRYSEELEKRVAARTEELTRLNEQLLAEVAERKEAERALRESEERFRAVFESDHAVMLLIDPERGTIVDASPGACSFYGFSREEFVTKRISDINMLGPEEIAERLQQAKSRQQRYFDFRHRLASGDVREVEVCVGPIVNAGRTLLFAIIHDVTDKKRAQEASLQSERKYRALFDESKDGVYSVLRNGEITDVNPSFLEMFGYAREEMIGNDIRILYLDPSERLRFQEEIEKKGFVQDYEASFIKRDGTVISCLLTSSLQFGDDGSVAGYRGIVRDLTFRKQLQRQLFQAQKMEAIGTLAGGIAHDFNNLLTVILGFSELLLIGKDERDPAYADLQKIHHSARSGADLIDRILTFSRKTETNPRPLDLNRHIEQVKKMLTRTIPKMIEIQLVLSPGLDRVNADPTQIEQVLMNLAVNAKDAMPDGGRLTIATENAALSDEYCRLHLGVKPGNYVLLSVADTGEGMGTETLQHIFEPFYTTKGTGGGTGLGLAMVYGIVEQHGGHITCSSELGRGTTFCIYLPVITVEQYDEIHQTKPVLLRGAETILLVDDEDFIRDLAKRILERSGYQVLAAANGKEALALYNKERKRIALVILDLIMPVMGGRQCLEELLRIDPQVKVIIASGYSAEVQAVKDAEPARAVVNKPYDITQLLRTLREVLDGG